MKLPLLAGLTLAFIAIASICQAQQTDVVSSSGSNYDYHDAFGPSFYTKNGNEYRAANGEPGPKYWQNRADYKLDARLNDVTNEVSGSEILTYTNNSPQKLGYLWMNLEQNLFKLDSRGTIIVPLSGSRDWGRGQVFDAGFKIKDVQLLVDGGGYLPVKYVVTDTRMQVFLPQPVAAEGGHIKVKIEYSFIIPDYGADRMGIQETKNGKIFQVGQWYPRMCVYDDVSGWNTVPYTGPAEFYLEYGDFDINITAPASHIVVASGELINRDEVYTAEQQARWAEAEKSDKTVMIRSLKSV